MSISIYTLVGIVIQNYPILILNVNISSFANKVFNYSGMASFSCHMQGSYLMEGRKTLQSKPEFNYLPSNYCTSVQILTCESELVL